MWSLLGLSTALGTAVLHTYGAYQSALVGLSLLWPERDAPSRAGAWLPRFLVLIPAHDEAPVISGLVESILADDYPREYLDVLVIADRCTDGTARVARAAGARVFERNEGTPGKTAAIADALSSRQTEGAHDAIAVFDADNRVVPGFFRTMAARLASGEQFVQARVDPKNPLSSWVAASSALGFYAIAAVVQRPRERLGLSTPVMGTGFVGNESSTRRFLLSLTALTDDLELACLLTEADVRVAYEEGAVVLDEKPVDLRVSLGQRHRWMQGRWAVLGRYGPRLLAQAAGPGPRPLSSRLLRLDQVVQLFGASLLFTSLGLALVSGTDALGRVLGGARFAAAPRPRPSTSLLIATAYYCLPALAIRRYAPPRALYGYYLAQPAYLLFSAPLAVTGFLRRRAARWHRTPRAPKDASETRRGANGSGRTTPWDSHPAADLDPPPEG